jgi:hypothetical protein
MKKLSVVLMLVAAGLIFGCNTEEQTNKVVFNPVCRRPAPKDNYTTTDWTYEKVKNCEHKNIGQLVGMTFTAYPSRYLGFHVSNEFVYGNEDKEFSVVSPEKFTVEAITTHLSEDWIKVKFESGKIGYIDGNWGALCVCREAFPDLFRCIEISKEVCH